MSEQTGLVAVHFGAGNIGRGFIGALLQEAGYFVVFADVNEHLIDSMNKAGSYVVTELDGAQAMHTYSNFKALNSISEQKELLDWIARADIITASVGAAILPRIAPTIEAGLRLREKSEPAIVMACENALRASEVIRDAMQDRHLAHSRAIFCNTAVDRIVPLQPAGSEPNVSVESFSEWVVDTSPLDEHKLHLPGAKLVSDLDPFIERKLYTVNTAHLAIAYLGQRAGHKTVVSALADPDVRQAAEQALAETAQVLVAKHGLDAGEHASYIAKTLERIANPAVDDEVVRVGRDPVRKLSRHERLIGPAAYFAENIGTPVALLAVIDAALGFESEGDSTVEQLQGDLRELTAQEFALQVCGISRSHPLSPMLEQIIDSHKSALSVGM